MSASCGTLTVTESDGGDGGNGGNGGDGGNGGNGGDGGDGGGVDVPVVGSISREQAFVVGSTLSGVAAVALTRR